MLCYMSLHPIVHHYMTHYMLPWSITLGITCLLDLLHDPLHLPLHAQDIHFILWNPINAAWLQQLLLSRPTGAISTCMVSRPFPVGFILQDNIPARGNWCEVHTDGVAAGTRSWFSWSWAVQTVVVTSSAWNVQDVTAKYSSNRAKFKYLINKFIVLCVTE